MGNTHFNSVKIPVNATITSIDTGYWYCNTIYSLQCNSFCAKAWQVGGRLNAAVALIADDCDALDGITVYKGNNAKTNVKKLLRGDKPMVISQVGPLKNVKPWVITDKASVSGAFYNPADDQGDIEEFWFIDNFVYFFDQAGFVGVCWANTGLRYA